MKITVAGVGGDVTISQDDLNKALAPLDSTIVDLKSSLNDSFLSQDTITNMVDKLAGDVQDSSAPQAGIKQILHNTVYDAIYNLGVSDDKKKTTDNTQAISNMVLQLVKEVVQSEKGWNDLTDSLVDDAVDLAVDELMKDETYAKLLKTKLGAATMEEVRAEVKKQLVEDPEFMNQVRGIASKAADNAQKGVNAGWSNEKIMNRLQADLLPDVTDLISNQVNKLGASAGDIVDNKVSDTVHKFLPGKLGDWVSDKISGKVNDAVTGKVDDMNKQVPDLIGSTIKQLTCGKHEYGDFEILKNPTCTEKGERQRSCTISGCVVTETEELPALGHQWSDWTPVKGDSSREYRICEVCNEVEYRDVSHNSDSSISTGLRVLDPAQTNITQNVQLVQLSQINNTLHIDVAQETASLHGVLSDLTDLRSENIETVVFSTESCTSTLSDVAALGAGNTPFILSHSGSTATFTVGGADHTALLR